MKILAVISSAHHEGYGATITRTVCKEALNNGAEVDYVYLYDLNFKSCGNCKTVTTEPYWCDKHDDLVPVLRKLIETDILVWSMPIYMYNICGTAQTFFDRFCIFLMNNHLSADRLPGKKVVLILTSEARAQRYEPLMDNLAQVLTRIFHMEIAGKIIAGGFKLPNQEIPPEIIEQARQIGRSLL